MYDSANLTNLMRIFTSSDRFVPIESPTGTAVVLEKKKRGPIEFLARNRDLHTRNCETSTNLDFVFPEERMRNFSISANASGDCIFTLLLPILNMTNKPSLRILNISSLKYSGPNSVKVVAIHTTRYTYKATALFEFSEQTSSYWRDFIVYGYLINFIIPASGTLEAHYQSQATSNASDSFFADHSVGMIQSPSYPMFANTQAFVKMIKCTKGLARINITIVYAHIIQDGHLKIHDKIFNIAGPPFGNISLLFETSVLTVHYSTGKDNATGKRNCT